jgi:hypothetical protein
MSLEASSNSHFPSIDRGVIYLARVKTKKVSWANWSVNYLGQTFSGRSQFQADRLADYLQATEREQHEHGLAHVAAVIRGVLKKEGKIPRDSTIHLEDQQVMVWQETAVGPRIRPSAAAKKASTKKLKPEATTADQSGQQTALDFDSTT